MIADLFWSPLMGPVWGAALVGGAAIALAGSLVVMLRLPFIGVAMSHAALLGAVLALLLRWPPLLGSLISCVVVAVLSVPLAERTGRDRNAAFAILFSVTMGLSLLLMRFVPGPRGETLSLLWGGILTVSWWQVAGLAGMGVLLLLLLMGLRRELKAILLDREIAVALGIPVNAVLVVLLAAAGGISALCLDLVGGLLLFALLVNPAVAARQLFRRVGSICAGAALFGVLSTTGGLCVSLCFDLPAGASIALVSVFWVLLAAALARLLRLQV
jgi:manganese/iron transport system permease protein